MLVTARSSRSRLESAWRSSRGRVLASTCPSMPKAMSLPVSCLSCAAKASSSRKPTLSVPRMSGCASPTDIGTVTRCRMPSGCGSRLTASCPAMAAFTAGCAATTLAVRIDAPTVASTAPVRFVMSSTLEPSCAW